MKDEYPETPGTSIIVKDGDKKIQCFSYSKGEDGWCQVYSINQERSGAGFNELKMSLNYLPPVQILLHSFKFEPSVSNLDQINQIRFQNKIHKNQCS